MAANAGVRDGEFIKFPGWDIPGGDQASYPNLKGKVSDLKQILLAKQGDLFLAFNTNGSFKSFAVLDFDKFQKSDSDLYVRVEFPGWYFVQGKNSPGNDLVRITDVNTVTGLRETVIDKYAGGNEVAAFNTDGYFKSKVVYPLKDGLENPSSLAGIYIRTTFLDFNFYSGLDSGGGNIKQTPQFANEIPQLITEASGISNSEGFNTDGWHKYTLQGPPPRDSPPTYKEPYQGIYYRTNWPDFIYLPGLDSPGNNLRNVGTMQLRQLLDEVRKDPEAVAVNTDGWVKSAVSKGDPTDFPGAEDLGGIYIQYINPKTWSATLGNDPRVTAFSLVSSALFALKGTVIVWCRWILNDSQVRNEYRSAVASATEDILNRIENGQMTAAEGAEEAHSIRNNFLIGMRARTSPPGLLVARSIKPAGGQFDYYLEKNAEVSFQKKFKDLEPDQAQKVFMKTIQSAGRANPNVTTVITTVGFISKGVMVIAASVSAYSVAVAPSWEAELGRQVLTWSGAIVAGQLGQGVGNLVGPVGAILGSFAGNILGGVGADVLANWFFGGSLGVPAEELMGRSALEASSSLVKEKMTKAGHGYYTHILRARHATAFAAGQHLASVVQEMVDETPDAANLQSKTSIGGDNQVLATIVWIRGGGDVLPTNARNPKDLITLIDYVKANLPT